MPRGVRRSRRDFCLGGVSGLSLFSSFGFRSMLAARSEPKRAEGPSGNEALAQLLEGNGHFAAGTLNHPGRSPSDFQQLSAGQSPIVAILGCSDSRVPPEILFDQPIGGIFAVRVAGNYVSGAGAAVKGSLEYAVEELHVPLIVVLGHSQCGAVKAAIAQIHGEEMLPGSIHELVDSIKPAVLAAERDSSDPLEAAVRSKRDSRNRAADIALSHSGPESEGRHTEDCGNDVLSSERAGDGAVTDSRVVMKS